MTHPKSMKTRRLTIIQLAQALASCWILSGGERRVPTSGGVLDEALESLKKANLLPSVLSASLQFADTSVGTRCVELPRVLDEAQSLHIAVNPNPSYEYTEFVLGPLTARQLLDELRIDQSEAIKFGRDLRARVKALS